MKATIFDGTSARPYVASDSQAVSTTTPYAWIDVIPAGPNDPEVLTLLTSMGFTDVVAAYTSRTYSGGMFQAFGDNVLGSTYACADQEDNPPVLIHCAWNAGCIITIRTGGSNAIATALEELKPRAPKLFAAPGPVPGILMQLILDSIDRQLTDLQTSIALLDGQIILAADPGQLTQLQQLRSPIEALATTIPGYAENLSESLVGAGSMPGVDAEGTQSLQTYSACVNDVVQRIDSAGSDIRSAIQDYQGQVSASQGNRINQLTLVSIIFLPITFMTGYFGMNFQWLVNSVETFWSWAILGAILPIAAVIVSILLLQRGGFKIGKGHEHRFHVRGLGHRAASPTSTSSTTTTPPPASRGQTGDPTPPPSPAA
jgi:Mg2+ and Co2+ transporter CorA